MAGILHLSLKVTVTTSILVQKPHKQILLETSRSASFFISLIQVIEKSIQKYGGNSVEEHETKL